MARTCPKNSNWFEFEGLVAGTKVGPCVRLDFEEKVASSHDGTCPRDLSQGLVSSCVTTLKLLAIAALYSLLILLWIAVYAGF